MERGVHAGGRASAGSKQQGRKGMPTPALVNRVLRCAPRARGWLQDRWRGVWRWSFRSERVPGAVRRVRAGRATPRRALLTRRRWRRTVLESGWPALRRVARPASASGGGVLDRTQSRERIPRPRARGMVRTAGHQHWPGSRRAMKPRTGAGHGVRHSSAATGGGSGAQGGRRITVGEAPPVGAVAGSGRLAHQALGAQQPMHGRVREMHAVGEVAAGYGATDHLPYRPGWMLGLDRDQQLGDLRRQPARATTIGACPGIQRIEAAAPVVQQPVAHRLGGHAGAQRARNGVLLLGLGTQLFSDPWRAGWQMDQVGDQAIAEQRHLAAQLLVGVIHGGAARRPPESPATARSASVVSNKYVDSRATLASEAVAQRSTS